MIARLVRGPAEGWLALVLVTTMAVVLAVAIDDVAWVLGRDTWTDVLPWCAALGVAFGFGGAKLGWSRWATHLVGAMFAGILIPVLAGWVVEPGTSPVEAFRLAAQGSVAAYVDLFVLRRPITPEVVHYVISLGAVCWAAGQFGAYAVFGHHRPLNAVVVIGLILITNMALTSLDQLGFLVVFSAAALFLLIGMHAFDERMTWVRRRIGDPAELSGLYLRGGSVFVALTLVGSLVLTDRAASAPLGGAWDNLDERLIELGADLQRYLPAGGAQRGGTVSFTATTRIPPTWNTDAGTAFRVTVGPGEIEQFYWRAGTWDVYDAATNLWLQSDGPELDVPAGSPLLEDTPDAPNVAMSREVAVIIRPDDGYRSGPLLSPSTPQSVDRDVRVRLSGDEGWFASIAAGGGRAPYTVTALVPVVGNDGWNANLLRAASRDYPPEVVARYATIDDEVLGPDARELLAEVRARTGADATPYDVAATMVSYFRSNAFRYDTDVSEYDCRGISVAECFARYREGYCLHYASTMILLLRAQGIPARLAQGFLPGSRALGSNEYVVSNRDAHAWVEVWFPGYGWYPFDPTGGSVARLDPLPRGPEIETPTEPPDPSGPPPTPRATFSGDFEPDDSGAGGGGGTITRPDDPTALITLSTLAAIIALSILFVAWWYGPRRDLTADGAWRSLGRLAGRFGFAPRPTQTVYEYAAALGDAVPAARPDLETVARATVEVAYGRASMTEDRLATLRETTRRLRLRLLRLAIPRRRRR